MVHNTELIYTGENFNAVFDTLDNAKSAFDVAKSILVSKLMYWSIYYSSNKTSSN